MLTDLGQAAPLAVLVSVPVGLLGAAVLAWLRHRSLAAAMAALGLVPMLGTSIGVLAVSGFMYTPELGRILVVCLAVTAVMVPTGVVLGRRLAREALWQSEARAAERQAERSRRELIAGMSHDLRSPLAGIRAMADAMLDGVVHAPAEVHDYLARIRGESLRMTDLVEDLFQLSRATSGTLQLNLERLALAEIASDAVAAESALAAAGGVRIRAVEQERWPEALGSDADLTRVLRNVLGNAVRHTPAGSDVRLTAGRAQGRAWLRVDDACGGIAESDLERIFDVGYRGTGARTPTADAGAGLGLAIARGLMTAQKGTIRMTNHGPGCRTELTLPLAGTPAGRP